MKSYKHMPEGWWECYTPLEQRVPDPCEVVPNRGDPRLRVIEHPVEFKWEQLPPSREKLADASLFDGSQMLFKAGAHMPLMVFMGTLSKRSPEALERRAARRRSRSRSSSSRQRSTAWSTGGTPHETDSAAVAASSSAAVTTSSSAAVAASSSAAGAAEDTVPPYTVAGTPPGFVSVIEMGKAAASGLFQPVTEFFL